ncbi:hypothetical protein SLA2020_516690 [Shorea laevis]
MSANNRSFVGWEEHIICPERGSRVVHFYLKDDTGDLVLAVIGTERSIRHMMYVVTGEFSQTYGSQSMKWRARREVVEWLQSLISRPSLDMQMDDSLTGFGSLEVSTISESFAHQPHLPDQMVPRKLKVHKSNIEWSGVAWICTKQLKHYPAFSRDGDSIAVHSFVFILAEEESHHVGYLEDMYEDKRGQKKVKVRWFNHNQEVKNVMPQLKAHPREIFITPHVQVISAESIDRLATVLTPMHYEKCMTVFSHTLSSGVHMCSRQFKNNRVKPFTLIKLRGYCNQAILYSLDGPLFTKQKAKWYKSNKDDREVFTDTVTVSGKRNRSDQGQEGLESGSGVGNSVPGNQVMKCKPTYPKLKLRFSRMGIVGHPQFPPAFRVDEKIELLCEDSGIRGCWFTCKVLKISHKKLRVQYNDLEDAEGSGKLEECVPAFKVAAPDKLGMRSPGRLTIRPCPPKDSRECKFEVGAPIDVWWSDGWWEGVVTGVGISNDDDMQVYLPGEAMFLTIQRENTRISRDWICNKWVDIKGRPDILSYLSANFNPGMKLSTSSARVEASGNCSTPSLEPNILAASRLEAAKEVERELPQSATSDDLNLNPGMKLATSGSGGTLSLEPNIIAVSRLEAVKEVEQELPQSVTSDDLKDIDGFNLKKRPHNNEEYEINEYGGGDADNNYKEHGNADPSMKSELILEKLESVEHGKL